MKTNVQCCRVKFLIRKLPVLTWKTNTGNHAFGKTLWAWFYASWRRMSARQGDKIMAAKPLTYHCHFANPNVSKSLEHVAWTIDPNPEGKTIFDKDAFDYFNRERGILEFNIYRPPMINRGKVIDDEMAIDYAIRMLGCEIDYHDRSYRIKYPENHPKATYRKVVKIGKDEAGIEIWGRSETEIALHGLHDVEAGELDAFMTDVRRRICRLHKRCKNGNILFVDHPISDEGFKSAFRSICWRKRRI